MNAVLKEILDTKKVFDENGKEYKLHSHTRPEQGRFLQELISEVKPDFSVEVGLAYGVSTLFICEAIAANKKGMHLVMDPFQKDWQNIGLKNIKDAGFDNIVEFRPEYADKVFSELYLKNKKIDFAYLDGSKVFDVVMFNTYILNKLLNINGIIVFDDCIFPGIKKVVRYLNNMPNFRIYKTHKKVDISWKRKIIRYFSNLEYIKKIINPDLHSYNNQFDYHCIAFIKTAEDTRPWNWYSNF